MNKKIVLLLLAIVTSGTSLAKERRFEAVPAAGQELRYIDGEAVLIAENEAVGFNVTYLPRDKKTAWIKVGIQNKSESSITISERSMTASSDTGALDVMTYEDRLQEQKRQEMWAGVAAGQTAAGISMSAANAGYQSQSGSYAGQTNATYYSGAKSANVSANTYGTYSGTTYNAGAAYQAQATARLSNQALVERQQANAAFARADLKERALKVNTLLPGQYVLGDIRFSLPKASKVQPAEFLISFTVEGRGTSILFREVR